MIKLFKIVNDEFKFIDYGVKSKVKLYLKLGFLIMEGAMEQAKKAVRKAKMTWDEWRNADFNGIVIVVNSCQRIQKLLMPAHF